VFNKAQNEITLNVVGITLINKINITEKDKLRKYVLLENKLELIIKPKIKNFYCVVT
jgi:hypothetical protein